MHRGTLAAWNGLGWSEVNSRKRDEAETAFNKATDIDHTWLDDAKAMLKAAADKNLPDDLRQKIAPPDAE